MMKVTTLESIPAKENPFHHDLWNMGTAIGENVMVMYSQHTIQKYIIVVNMETGERIKIEFDSKEKEN